LSSSASEPASCAATISDQVWVSALDQEVCGQFSISGSQATAAGRSARWSSSVHTEKLSSRPGVSV